MTATDQTDGGVSQIPDRDVRSVVGGPRVREAGLGPSDDVGETVRTFRFFVPGRPFTVQFRLRVPQEAGVTQSRLLGYRQTLLEVVLEIKR